MVDPDNENLKFNTEKATIHEKLRVTYYFVLIFLVIAALALIYARVMEKNYNLLIDDLNNLTMVMQGCVCI